MVRNLETKSTDGNPVFTPRQWVEKFKQFTKREHKIDITPLLKGEDITDSGWAGKEQAIQEDFVCGVEPEALFQITRAEYKTNPDSIKIEDLPVIHRILFTETKHLPQPRRFLLGETIRRRKPEEYISVTPASRK